MDKLTHFQRTALARLVARDQSGAPMKIDCRSLDALRKRGLVAYSGKTTDKTEDGRTRHTQAFMETTSAVTNAGVALVDSDDTLDAEVERLQRFVLPGGCLAASALHAARTVCRRAERRTVALHRDSPLSEASLRTLNRLSDLLFVMARVENRRAGVPDVEWEGRQS